MARRRAGDGTVSRAAVHARGEAADRRGGAAAWDEGERGLPAPPDRGHPVLRLGAAGAPGGAGGASGEGTGTTAADPGSGVGGGSGQPAVGGGGTDDGERQAQRGDTLGARRPRQRLSAENKGMLLASVGEVVAADHYVGWATRELGLSRATYYRRRRRAIAEQLEDRHPPAPTAGP